MNTNRIGKWMLGLGLAAGMGLAGQAQAAAPNLMVTEIMSKSDATEDWFEITNFGDAAADIIGWTYDDESADLAEDVPLTGVTSIAAGESIIVLQIDDDLNTAAEVAAFRAFWGGLTGVQIATIDSNSAGLGKGDGITLFDALESIALQQFYGDGDATDPLELIDDEHAGVWAGGDEWDSANYIGGSWVAGSAFDGQHGIFASSSQNGESDYEYGSPGSAVPEPASLALLGLGGVTMLRRRR